MGRKIRFVKYGILLLTDSTIFFFHFWSARIGAKYSCYMASAGVILPFLS